MLNFSPLDGATFPLSGKPGAALSSSLVGSSNASASSVFEEISGPVDNSLSVLMVAVSPSFAGVDFLALVGEVVEICRKEGIGGRCWDVSADVSRATRVVLLVSRISCSDLLVARLR
jgi:hypothetical protein